MTIEQSIVTLAGAALIGVLWFYFFGPKTARRAELRGNVQEVRMTVKGGYVPDIIRVRQGVPLQARAEPAQMPLRPRTLGIGDETLEQIIKQLYKLIDVLKVYELSNIEAVDRELVLIKVAASENTRPEIMQIVDIFRAKIVDLGDNALVVEATGDSKKIDALEEMLKKYGIREMVRTGKISLARSAET